MKKKPFIEENIEAIKKWQVAHEKKDRADFKAIHKSLAGLPDTVAMAKAVADSVQKTVNGNLRDIESHLGEQDKNMETLSKKVAPLDGTRKYIVMTGKVLAYILSMAIGVAAVVEIVKAIIK